MSGCAAGVEVVPEGLVPLPPRRVLRVASRIKFLVSHVLQRELSDPRLGFVTVLRVEPTADFKEARVYVSVLGSQGDRSKALHALEAARGYVQRRVGRNLRTRNIPFLRFVLDESQDRISRVEEILQNVREEDGAGEESDSCEDPGDGRRQDGEEAREEDA